MYEVGLLFLMIDNQLTIIYCAAAHLEPFVLPSKSSAFPTYFQIVLSCEAQTPDYPCVIHANSHPTHSHIDLYLTALERLVPLLKLPAGQITAVAHVGRNEVAFSPRLPSVALTGFLSQIALLGGEDLAEVRRQVEGYPYERIAQEYERLTREAKRTRRALPLIELDKSPLLTFTILDVLGGPSTTIRISEQRDVIRLRGVPFNHVFAALANDAIMKNARAAICARLPILGNPRTHS